jgi:carboxyl-terminal processing protease
MHKGWRRKLSDDRRMHARPGADSKITSAQLKERYQRNFNRSALAKSEEVFETFMNAYLHALDPHAVFMAPAQEESASTSELKSSMVGIGLVLKIHNGFATLREIVPDGPAARSGQLSLGDRIVAIAQDSGGAMVNVIGWPLNDQIALLRGMPGSTLSIEVLPRNAVVGSMPVRVALTRSRINNSQLTAALSVVNVKTETSTRRIGIISIPSFYLDFEARRRNEKDYVSVSRDVAQILEKVKQQNVEAVLIDLRNNGGGSLIEAVALSGLFVKGPIVQHRDRAAKVTLDSAPDGPFAWEGPVGVLINNASASASEIFAGAMQDYGRGIVIGENSFGMGTVQTMVDFDRSKTQAPQLGTLKLSITQFFRVNGSSTQLRGIIPDIALPAANETAVSRETDYESAIPWAEIAPASYTKVADLSTLIDGLAARHKRRATAQAKDKDKGTALADALQILGDQLNMEPKGAKK